MLFSEFVFFVLVVKGVRGDSHNTTTMPTELPFSGCNNTYSVAHERQMPAGNEYFIANRSIYNETLETCQEWCNEDVNCRSVSYENVVIGTTCSKGWFSLQNLKDLARDTEDEIIAPDNDLAVTYITYDRDCGSLSSNKCINKYLWSHDRQAPAEKYKLGSRYYRNTSSNVEFCRNWCNEDENCRSVVDRVFKGKYFQCVKFNISVQRLKDIGSDITIPSDRYTSFISYDRYCGRCNYPVSHDKKRPNYATYHIGSVRNNTGTVETCLEFCDLDVNCRSVTYKSRPFGKIRVQCDKFNISVQELRDAGKENEIANKAYTTLWQTYATYDKDCGPLPSNKCTKIYIVSYDGQAPLIEKYMIEYQLNENATAKMCQDYCNEDKKCKSVLHGISETLHTGCAKFNISVQQLKDMGRDSEIKTGNDEYTTYKTYDRYCGKLSSNKCTEKYVTSHDRARPHWKYLNGRVKKSVNGSAEACQDYCNEDVNCWSVLHQIKSEGDNGGCFKFSISVQQLNETGRDDEIMIGDVKYPTFITFDRYCVGCNHWTDLDGADLCRPINRVGEADCDATPGCCSVEVEKSNAPFSMCIKHRV